MGPGHQCKSCRKWELQLHQVQEKLLTEMSGIRRSMCEMVEARKAEFEIIRKSANSINVITRFFAGQCNMSSTDLRKLLEDADALLSIVFPTNPTDHLQIPDQSHQSCSYMSPHVIESTNSDFRDVSDDADTLVSAVYPANPSEHIPGPDQSHQSGSTDSPHTIENTYCDHCNDHDLLNSNAVHLQLLSKSTANSNQLIEDEEQKKLRKKYSNKYRYMPDKVRSKVPVVKLKSEESTNINNVTVNDAVPGTSKDGTAQREFIGNKKITRKDVEQNKDIYEMLKHQLSPSHPYNDSTQDVNNADLLRITKLNGETILKPLSYVQPLILLEKIDCNTIPVQNKQTLGDHSQSSSKRNSGTTSYCNSTNTTAKINKIETSTRVNTRKRSNTNIKTGTKMEKLTIKKKK